MGGGFVVTSGPARLGSLRVARPLRNAQPQPLGQPGGVDKPAIGVGVLVASRPLRHVQRPRVQHASSADDLHDAPHRAGLGVCAAWFALYPPGELAPQRHNEQSP